MTARIAGFVSRDDAGLRPPKSVSRNITPGRGGVTYHYGGPAQRISRHEECVRRWAAWQEFHQDERGWVDVAYTGAVCDHGYAFAGRGIGVRTAANGTDAGNQNYYAVVWIGGEGEKPSRAALDAFEWWVATLRRSGAGDRVVPHSYHKATGCPGGYLRAVAQVVDRQPITMEEDDMPNLDEIRAVIREEIGAQTLTRDGAEVRTSRVVTDSLFQAGWGRGTVQTFEQRFTEVWMGVRAILARDGRLTDDEREALADAIVEELPDDLAQKVLDGLGQRILGHQPQ